jgi:hypothetical protein
MDTGQLVLLTFALGFIFLIIQRTEATKRRGVAYFMLIFVLLVLWYVAIHQIWGTGLVALLLALFLNYLFWLLIGRYNPVGSSDDIHVLGMDD